MKNCTKVKELEKSCKGKDFEANNDKITINQVEVLISILFKREKRFKKERNYEYEITNIKCENSRLHIKINSKFNILIDLKMIKNAEGKSARDQQKHETMK